MRHPDLPLRTALLLAAALAPMAALAQGFIPPEQITQFGRTYTLAYQDVAPNGRALYEYTSAGETVDNWTTLVTLNYAKDLVSDPATWAKAVKASLDANTPKPHYTLYTAKGSGYARFIFEPDGTHPSYESNIHKSFHTPACGGLLVLQYAARYAPSEEQGSAGKLARLRTIATENAKQTVELERSDWVPACR